MSRLLAAAERAVAAALQGGADEAEAYVWEAADLQAMAVRGATTTKESRGGGIGVRALKAGALGFAAGAPADEHGCAQAGQEAARLAAKLPPSGAALPEPSRSAPDRGPRFDAAFAALEPSEAARLAAGAVREAERARGKGTLTFATAVLARNAFRFAVASSRGVAVEERGVRATLEVECRVRLPGGAERNGTASRAARHGFDPGGAGREARRRAEAMAGARRVPRGTMDAVLDPDAAALLLQLLGSALSGASAAAGRTVLAKLLGQRVASDALTLRDGPGFGGPRAQRWDDEGTPARDQALIEGGVLRSWVHDHASAARLGHGPRGNGLRGADERYRRPPQAMPMGLAVDPGKGEAEDLAAEMQRGVLVRGGLLGLAALNPTTGEFSVAAPNAFAVRRGTPIHALPPVTLAGDLLGLLAGVRRVGGDARPNLQGRVPSLLAGGVTVAC